MCGLYNRKEFEQIMIHKGVKTELTGIYNDIMKVYKIEKKKDISYSKVIQCLMVMPADDIRSKVSGAQEIVTAIIFNGSGMKPAVVENAG